MSGPADERPTTPGLSGLEGALQALVPRPAALDRDAVVFRAGRASVRRWPWACATAGSTAAAAALGVLLLARPVVPVERVVYLPAPAPPGVNAQLPPPPPAPEPSTPRGRFPDAPLARGLDGLADPSPFADLPARFRIAPSHSLTSVGEFVP
jgi:hypothetical protein